ncbi:methyltransferase family protein [Allosphingosinicella indica]|uniref:Isoprenylcysteine carboxyl methyltransferase (ICMT) family protein n=1 Tax=Allosphingosinicella indica TaxID=941907 RepID=A0A1X7GQ63_9SPHN|nr:isoprenylcysteine carboxylmethyltransferase family protein [Allosphingosinicella indica]SMF72951.1 Isoprenylcysteine carboxyl methyltransferase (ICMT) family protein [Allosphingosinicella indica]
MNVQSRIEPAKGVSDARPRSAVSGAVGFVGLAGLVAWAALSRAYGFSGPDASLVALLACAVPMILWSLLVDRVHRNPTTGIDWDAPPRAVRETIDVTLVKITGIWTIWGTIGALYCIGRWYWAPPYLYAMELFAYSAVPMLALSVPYVLWIDRRLREPRDGAWHFGRLVIGRPDGVDREAVYDFLRSWAIKAFFLAFMVSIVPGNWADLVRATGEDIAADPISLARWLISAMFLIDVAFATVGYALTMKPLDAHIRSANPYASAWMAALICYPPFIMMSPGGPLDYHPGTADWIHWLEGMPLASAAMGAVLVALTAVYAWATVAFGIRFSNLTHRGILTHGPYAWSKHPAYLSKNIFWWLATLPFLATSGNPVDMIRNTVVLALVSGVYYWRARTEEQHLSADPDYVAYARWMDRHGPVPRAFAALRGVIARRASAPAA